MECMGLTSVAWRQPVSACPTDGFKTVYVLRKGCLSVSWALYSRVGASKGGLCHSSVWFSR